jgi:hypothetical protein
MRISLRNHLFQMRNNTWEQDFGTRKIYFVSNVNVYAEFKYTIIIFPSPTVFAKLNFLLLVFWNFGYFLHRFFNTRTNILDGFEQRVFTNNLPLSNH